VTRPGQPAAASGGRPAAAGPDRSTAASGGPPAPTAADRARLHEILTATWLAQGCYALAKLGLADLMAAGPRPVADLAEASGTDARALSRMLRALAAAGLVAEGVPGAFGLTPVSAPLAASAPRSSHDAAIMFGEEVFRSFADIVHTLRTGQPAFDKAYGRPFYDYLDSTPEAARTFSAAMGEAPVPASLSLCDLSAARIIADIGGGNGRLLNRVLRTNREARGVLVDLPLAVAQARARLTTAGLADRVEFVEGSFFGPLPPGADVYVLCRVLHNWGDEDASRVLGRVRDAMGGHGRLIVLEELLEGTGPAGAGGTVGDLLILLMLSGCDRTRQEYLSLLDRNGFSVAAIHPPPERAGHPESAIEAVPRC
jgi:SAM-dependent methyltransferase